MGSLESSTLESPPFVCSQELRAAPGKEPLALSLSRVIGQAAFCRATLACLRPLLRYLSGVIAAFILGFTVRVIWAQDRPTSDLSKASLEDLMNIKVTSVSKKQEKLAKTAAAVHVISQEEIRRSGAANIPGLLRMVPGLAVAQITASTWAITARGFNGQFANKLLVLMDGRTVYDPAFSGVYWDAQDVVLEDIERIEVIRGPGATVWGTNAVNGVINIITKDPKETQGGPRDGRRRIESPSNSGR